MIEIYTQYSSDVWFAVALNGQQIVSSSFGINKQATINNILENLPFNVPFQVFHEPVTYAINTLEKLYGIYEGKDIDLNLPMATAHLPNYTKKVLKTTMQIPLGYVTSYGNVARAVGGGPRAVGNIMAGNRFAPIVPCHRVVKTDFTLGGYGFGLSAKLQILDRERRGFTDKKQIQTTEGCLTVFPVEFVLQKFPKFC